MHPVPASPQIPVRILIVEDEEKTRASVAEGFGMEGWIPVTAENGEQALALVRAESFDLIVLDWMLPGCDGYDVLQRMRALGAPTPVLMLTVRDAVRDRVAGLDAGADDYLTKPFAFAELLARSKALLRRSSTQQSGHVLSYDGLMLDTRARVAWRDGKEIPLTPREVDLLDYLLRFQGQIVTREMLEREVWKQSRRFTSLNNVIDVQFMRLRRKIDGPETPRLLHTLRGVGYRLGKEIP